MPYLLKPYVKTPKHTCFGVFNILHILPIPIKAI